MARWGRLTTVIAVLLLGVVPAWAGSPAVPNHVLELDGGYAELPPNIFNNLTEATFEAWVRWDVLGTANRSPRWRNSAPPWK